VTEPSRGLFGFDASWRLTGAIALIMVGLALVGALLAALDAPLARKYWMTLIPVYGVLCTVTAWRRSRQAGGSGGALVLRQALHWLAIGGAVLIDFSIQGAGIETQQNAGFNALLLLALGCFLAGVHLDWSFGLVGLLLALTLVVAARAQQYLWLLFVVGLVLIGVLVLAWRSLGSEGKRSQATDSPGSA
jgi:hypothetical protein